MKAYQLKVTLQRVKPPVWRRIIVPSGIKFSQLRVVLTEAMGWIGGHLYGFRFNREKLFISHNFRHDRIVEQMFYNGYDCKSLDARKIKIDKLLKEGSTFYFEYDFGDGWVHNVKVEKLIEDYAVDYPQVIKYAGNCPPEDVGGPKGYEDFLAAVNDPSDPESEHMREWGHSQFYMDYEMEQVNEELMEMPAHGYRDIVERSEFYGDDALLDDDAYDDDEDEDEDEDEDDYDAYDDDDDYVDAFKAKALALYLKSFLSQLERLSAINRNEMEETFENPKSAFEYLIFGRKPTFDLRGLFKSFKLDELRELASEMDLHGRSGLRKSKLIDLIYDQYMESDLLYFVLTQVDKEQIEILNAIMNAEIYYVEDEDFPYDFALILLLCNIITAFYDKNRIAIAAPREIKEKYAETLDKIGEMLEGVLDELDEFAGAAANLYGVLPVKDFMAVYCDQTGSDFDEDMVRLQLSKMVEEYTDDDADYRIRGDFLISDMLKDWGDDELNHLRLKSQAHTMNILPKEQFLLYADWFYFEETPAHTDFIEFLRDKVKNPVKDAVSPELLTAEICSLLRQWAPAQECFNILESSGIKFNNLKEVKKASEFITQMYNHTRIWGNNGWTPNELRNSTRAASGGAKRKIGRNEPCPCGSGKKYKNCCGSGKPAE
jgi:hypothetical protein